MKQWLAAALVIGCGSSGGARKESHAVGTYIGSADCEYTGGVGVFAGEKVDKGPRLIRAAGPITIKCPSGTSEVTAVMPTATSIAGVPKTMKVGDKAPLTLSLVAGLKPLLGETTSFWSANCPGVAELAPEDSPGTDRTRELIATGKGKCQVTAILGTGKPEAQYQGQGWQADVLITVE